MLTPVQVKALGDHISRDDYHMKSPKPEEPIAEVKPEAEAKQGDVNTKAIIKEALLKAIERKKQTGEFVVVIGFVGQQ